MNAKRTHIVIPEQLAVEIDTIVGKRWRSAFLPQYDLRLEKVTRH